MLFALDKNGNRVNINQTHSTEDYFCPLCGEKLALKKGAVKRYHFSHLPHNDCCDSWHYDMTDWHMRWQSRFPAETQEIVKEKNGIKHRADVLLENEKAVYEFQHSSLTAEEFHDRNRFYNSLGYKVIWIFDFLDQFEEGLIENYKNNIFSWSNPRKTFRLFKPNETKEVILFFQIQKSVDENETMIQLKKQLAEGYELFGDDEEYYDDHKKDKNELIRITWAPESGFERFATDGFIYDEIDIINYSLPFDKKIVKKEKIGSLYDQLKEAYKEDHTTYYFGCPISTTHYCANSIIDVPESKYKDIMPCERCKYKEFDNHYNPICRKRFIELKLPDDTPVVITKRTSDGFAEEFYYEDDDGKHLVELPVFNNTSGKTVFTLWEENNYRIAIFKNTRTGKFVKITKNPTDQKKQYGRVYGYFSSDQYRFNSNYVELYGLDKSEWINVWNVK